MLHPREQLEGLLFSYGREAVESHGALADQLADCELDRGARGRKAIVGAERYEELVADSASFHHDASGVALP